METFSLVIGIIAGVVLFVGIPIALFVVVHSSVVSGTFKYHAPLGKHTSGGESIEHQLAILAVCIRELEPRAELTGPSQYLWQSKLKVAKLMARQLEARIDWEPELCLAAGELEDVLADHPLLQLSHHQPPDPSKRYAHQQWYQDIRTKVEQFAESMKADATE